MITIGIVGSTSHIAKGLIYSFLSNTDVFLYLFSRNNTIVNSFLKKNSMESENYKVLDFDSFRELQYDVVINCVGIADPVKQKDAGSSIFFITETFDNMILDYLTHHENVLYINFSSGAVYGTSFDKPVDYNSSAEVLINYINEKDYYRIAKLNSEAKHRSLKEYNIVDLRVFSYFSRFINLNTSFLMTEILNSIIKNEVLTTSNINIVRDYIHLSDLYELINCCIKKKYINDVFDVYSKAPLKKFDLLNALKEEFGLKFKVEESVSIINATGLKSVYSSDNFHAVDIGYEPKYSSIETIIDEVGKIIV